MLLSAGRGLAAAHAAGLVHRDFKPDNVLVGTGTTGEERVLVTDFGLVQSALRAAPSDATPNDATVEAIARLRSTHPPPPLSLAPPVPHDSALPTIDANSAAGLRIAPLSAPSIETPLTRTGTLMGTPGYMAPEQILLQPVDARSDQFAFCVTLYDALCDGRPFPGATLMARLEATVEGRIRPGRRKACPRASPSRVGARALGRTGQALAVPMDLLLEELARDPAARARPWVIAAGVALLAAAPATWGEARRTCSPPRALEPCRASRTPLGGLGTRRPGRASRPRFAASGAPFADDALRAVSARLSTFVRRRVGRDARRSVASLAGVRGEQVPEVQTLRMACLDERLTAASRATTDVLGERANRDVVTKAIDVTGGLRRLEPVRRRGRPLRTPVPGCRTIRSSARASKTFARSWRR